MRARRGSIALKREDWFIVVGVVIAVASVIALLLFTHPSLVG